MPEKEGAEEKTTKDVVTKKQKQLMNKEEYIQEIPDDVKNILMKGARRAAGEFSKGGEPKKVIKKGVKSTIKNVIGSKSVQNFLNNEYIPEEGYDVARDQGRVKPSKDKKDATTMPRSKEMEKTRKVNKGPSALERVKADIEKRYGKGAIMDVSKEELDLTQVAEAFGGYVIDENKILDKLKKAGGRISSVVRTAVKGKGRTGREVRPEVKKTGPIYPRSTQSGREIAATGDVFGNDPQGDAVYDIQQKTAKGGTKTVKQIAKDQIGVPPGGKEAPVTTYRIGDKPPESKVERARKTKLKKDLQKDMMSRAEGPQKSGRKQIGSTYRKDLSSTVKAKKQLKAQPLVKGLEKAKTKVGTGFKTFRQTASNVSKNIGSLRSGVTQATKNVASKLTKGSLKTATKGVGKKAAGLVARKTIGRAAGKALAKQIPGIGQVISGGEAIARFATGDVVGGALSAAEMIPGLGLAAGAANVARDISRTKRAVKTIRKIKPLSKGMKIFPKTRVGRQITKLNKQARANPLTSVAAGGATTYVGSDLMDKRSKRPKIRVPKMPLDEGHVGRRKAG